MLSTLSVLLGLVPTFVLADYIVVRNDDSTQNYYLSFILENIDASSCDDSVTTVYILENNEWRSTDQYYNEGTTSDPVHRYAFNHDSTAFGDMLPISVRIEMASGREVTLWGILEDLNTDSEFTSSELICDGTLSPTPPTPEPTTRAPTAPTTPHPTGPTMCVDENALEWRSYGNQLMLNGNQFNMKGLSWFGFETTSYNLHGLEYHDIDWYLQWIVDHGFNAVRLPFSIDFMASESNQNLYKEAVQKMGEYGLLVMADLHSGTPGDWTEGFWDRGASEGVSTWETVADLLIDEWNVFIADLFNEPHDITNSQWTDWITFCESVADAIWQKGVNWMVAVEGTNAECSVLGCCWGENLEGARDKGITFDLDTYGANRFVWSPHVYGGDVTGSYSYSEEGWQSHWGYLVDGSYPSNEATSIIGEFGTKFQGVMQDWLNSLVDYLEDIEQRNTFFWCLNPDSGDTGGLLADDWTTDETDKLEVLDRLQPSPSKVEYDASSNTVCVQFSGESTSPSSPQTDQPTPRQITPTESSPNTPSPTPSPTPHPTPLPTSSSESEDSSFIVVRNENTREYYLAFELGHIDGSSCDDSVSGVSILQNGEWRGYKQHYNDVFAFNYQGIKFGDMLPISVRIEMTSGREISSWGILEDLDQNSEFTSNQEICDSSSSAYGVMVNPQIDAVREPSVEWKADLTVYQLVIVLAVSVAISAVVGILGVYSCRKCGGGRARYQPVLVDTESEMEDFQK